MMKIEIQYVINYCIGPRNIPKSSDLSSNKIEARSTLQQSALMVERFEIRTSSGLTLGKLSMGSGIHLLLQFIFAIHFLKMINMYGEPNRRQEFCIRPAFYSELSITETRDPSGRCQLYEKYRAYQN